MNSVVKEKSMNNVVGACTVQDLYRTEPTDAFILHAHALTGTTRCSPLFCLASKQGRAPAPTAAQQYMYKALSHRHRTLSKGALSTKTHTNKLVGVMWRVLNGPKAVQ